MITSNAMPVSGIELLAAWMQSTITRVKNIPNVSCNLVSSNLLSITAISPVFFNNLFLSLFSDLVSVKSAYLLLIALVYIAFREFCKIMDNYCTI